MSKVTELASSQITAKDTITVELVITAVSADTYRECLVALTPWLGMILGRANLPDHPVDQPWQRRECARLDPKAGFLESGPELGATVTEGRLSGVRQPPAGQVRPGMKGANQ